MAKLRAILDYLEKHDAQDMVIIMDELGSATDQDQVLELAQSALEVLSGSGQA